MIAAAERRQLRRELMTLADSWRTVARRKGKSVIATRLR